MTGSVAVMLGLSLVLVLVITLAITVFILVRRKRGLSTPEARYQRDIRGIRMSTYLQTKPRPAPQSGADGLENKYIGYSGQG